MADCAIQGVIAHELGHAFGYLDNIEEQGVDDENLMSFHRNRCTDWKLRTGDWYRIHFNNPLP